MKLPLALLLTVAGFCPAATMFTFAGTVGSSSVDALSPGDSFTLSFVLADYAATGAPANSRDEADEYDWWQEEDGQAPLFADIAFTQANGTFTNPVGSAAEMYLYMGILGGIPGTYLMLVAGVDEGPASQMGLTVGGQAVKYIFLGLSSPGSFPARDGSHADPEAYFGTAHGAYAVSDIDGSYIELEDGSSFQFQPTVLTIATAVPEPSGAALLSLAGAALLGMSRKRQR